MKKLFLKIVAFTMLILGICLPVNAASEGGPIGRDVNCLVLTNTGNFDVLNPQPLRTSMEAFGGVDYTVKYRLDGLTVEEMLQYDVVWVFNFAEWGLTERGLYGEITPKDLSDLLGGYVEKGGALLECMYLSYIHPANTLGLGTGKYIENGYSPFEQTNTLNASPLNMGNIQVAEHPIMNKVMSVSTDAVTYRTVVSQGATPIAGWQETDAIMAAVKGKVVALNMLPISENTRNPQLGIGCWLYGDALRLIDNSIKWLFTQIYDFKAPDKVKDFKLAAIPADGKYNISMSWENPTKKIDGSQLTKIDSICIYREGVKVHTLKTDLTLGAAVTYTDQNVPQGNNEYKIVVYSEAKAGYPSFGTIYSGNDVPAAVSKLYLSPSGNGGLLKWEAPEKGKGNGWIDASTLKYKITRNPGNVVVAASATETTYTDNTIKSLGEYSYTVIPFTKDGEGVPSTTKPFKLYTDDAIWMGTSDITKCSGKFYDENGPDQESTESYKEYLLILRPQNPENGERMSVSFNDFALKGAELVVLDGDNAKAPHVEGSPFFGLNMVSQMKNITASAGNESGALSFYYRPTTGDVRGLGWDADIACVTKKNKDMKVVSIKGDEMPVIDKSTEYMVIVENNGQESVSNVKVNLLSKDNEILSDYTITKTIKPGQIDTARFSYTPTTNISFRGVVELTGEENRSNDSSAVLSIDVQPKQSHIFKLGGGDISAFYGPIVTFFKHSVTQTMYYPTELGVSVGDIKGIRFYNDFEKEMLNTPVKIHIGESEQKDMSYGFIDEKYMTKVFDGYIDFPVGNNEITIKFTTPYEYKGKNLVIRVERPYNIANTNGDMGQSFYIFFDEGGLIHRQMRYQSNTTEFDIDGDRSEWKTENRGPHTGFVIDCSKAASISGTVKDKDGVKVDSVKVVLKGTKFTTYTNAEGYYTFPGLVAGKDTLVLEKYGYETLIKEVDVLAEGATTQDIVLSELKTITVKGIVKDNSSALVVGALVKMSGYSNYQATTDAKGEFAITDVYSGGKYSIEVNKDTYHGYKSSIITGAKDTTLSAIVLEQWNIPAMELKVSAGNNTPSAKLEWIDYTQLNFNKYIYDDGTAETSYGVAEGKEGWFGTCFRMNDTGYIHSIDIHGARNWYLDEGVASQKTLTVDIFDQNRVLISSSKPFLMPEDGWITVNMPYTAYKGAFYAMVHFTQEVGVTHQIACDYDGPYANAELNYYSDGAVWSVVQASASGVQPFSFLIRANVFEAKQGGISKANSTTIAPEPKKYDGKYSLYRFNEKDMSKPSSWTKITNSPIAETKFTDNAYGNLDAGVYRYAVQVNYTQDMNSEYTYSNSVYKEMLTDVTFEFTSNNPALEVDNIIVDITANDNNPSHVYSGVTDKDGKVVFSQIWKETYSIIAAKDRLSRIDTTIDLSKSNTQSIDIAIKEELRPAYNLKVDKQEKTNVFSWNKSIDLIDGFESHIDFAVNSPGKVGWIYRDGANVKCYGISNAEFPNHGEPSAFVVFNPKQTNPSMEIPTVVPHAGKKYISCFSSPLAQNDKWIISPKLNYTNDFTFKFFAKTFDASAGLERFQVGYSITDTASSSFRWIQGGNFAQASIKWVEYIYTIPGNAKHVALRSVSNDQWMFMVDDIFIGAEKEDEIMNIKEYEVYLDGKMVGKTTEKTYNFTDVDDLSWHKAGVVVVYETGKSPMEEISFGGLSNEEENSLRNVGLYPNPASEVIHLEGIEEVKKIEVYSLSGSLVDSYSVMNTTFDIRISNYTQGVYFIKLIGENSSIVKKFIKK